MNFTLVTWVFSLSWACQFNLTFRLSLAHLLPAYFLVSDNTLLLRVTESWLEQANLLAQERSIVQKAVLWVVQSQWLDHIIEDPGVLVYWFCCPELGFIVSFVLHTVTKCFSSNWMWNILQTGKEILGNRTSFQKFGKLFLYLLGFILPIPEYGILMRLTKAMPRVGDICPQCVLASQ